jgi:hypothetical protein
MWSAYFASKFRASFRTRGNYARPPRAVKRAAGFHSHAEENNSWNHRVPKAQKRKTADLSTTLRSGRDDKFVSCNEFVISTGA